jgi:Fungalysin/Thermolysin Propeptide Motif
VRLPATQGGDLAPLTARSARAQDKAMAFFRQYGSIFGLTSAHKQLREVGHQKHQTAGTHISYQQYYAGVPVGGAVLKAHFDAMNQLRAVNGTVIPNIGVSPAPTRSASSVTPLALSTDSHSIAHAGFGLALDSFPHLCASTCISREVRRRAQVGLSARPVAPCRQSGFTRST